MEKTSKRSSFDFEAKIYSTAHVYTSQKLRAEPKNKIEVSVLVDDSNDCHLPCCSDMFKVLCSFCGEHLCTPAISPMALLNPPSNKDIWPMPSVMKKKPENIMKMNEANYTIVNTLTTSFK